MDIFRMQTDGYNFGCKYISHELEGQIFTGGGVWERNVILGFWIRHKTFAVRDVTVP